MCLSLLLSDYKDNGPNGPESCPGKEKAQSPGASFRERLVSQKEISHRSDNLSHILQDKLEPDNNGAVMDGATP